MSFLYFYPNRPTLIPADPANPMHPSRGPLDSIEASGRYVWEKKWNGDNCMVYTDGMKLWNRDHGLLHYQPPPEVLDELRRFPAGSIVNCEVVDRHTKGVKNLLVVHCVMAWKGRLLNGATWGESRKILEDWDGFGKHVVLSQTWKTGFWDRYLAADGAVIEGGVLKDPNGKLRFSTTPLADVNWMLKVRKACKKYNY